MPGSASDKALRVLLKTSAIFCAGVVLAIFFFLFYFSWPVFKNGQLQNILSWHWRPYDGEFGILPMIAGSLCLASLSMLIAYPLGVGICLFVQGLGPKFLRKPIISLVQFMVGIPTVVYAFVAAFSLVPFLRHSFPFGTGFSWLAASLTLSVLVLPTIVLILTAQLDALKQKLNITCLSLGLTHKQSLTQVILPSARRGLLAAGILGFGRALGDTLISLMIAGNAPQLPDSLFDSIRTLTAHVALVVATDSQSMIYTSVFASGLILFFLSASINLTLYFIHAQAKKKY
ncbi:PstC family ABC transporter permease [Desulfovulcanus sp.]